jgi:hypothetical protein
VAEACSCTPLPQPCAAGGSGEAVFIGTPTSVAPGPSSPSLGSTVRFHFEVEEALRGDVAKSIDVDTGDSTGMCGFPFVMGMKYLVYAAASSSVYTTSLCSRTGLVAGSQDDLALLREAAAGRPRPRLAGSVARYELNLDGFFMHGGVVALVPDIPVTIHGAGRNYEVKTNDEGRFALVGLEPGTYGIEPHLPSPYQLLFDTPTSVTLGGCLAEAPIFVAAVPLSGVARDTAGEPAGKSVGLRVAQLDATNTVAFARTTMAFVESDGRWKLPGLPAGRYLLGVNTFDPPTSSSPYPTMWYPQARRAEDAEVIDVRDERPQSIDFRLPERLAAVSISGRIVDAAGNGVPRAEIKLYDDDDPHAIESWKEVVAYGTSDSAGRFTLAGFKGRRYHVTASTGVGGRGRDSGEMAPVSVGMDAAPPSVQITLPPR